MSDEEDKYIKQSEVDHIARIRRERQLEALRLQELDGIAKVLHTDEDIAQEAMDLGFDRDTARILHLVPVIQVAWADGVVQDDERAKVLELAEQRGIAQGSPSYEYLELLMAQEPSPLYFERTNKVIAHLLAQDPTGSEEDDLMQHLLAVAGAAGGFFGLSKVSKEERQLIAELHAMFSK